jgi:hypothetical protein
VSDKDHPFLREPLASAQFHWRLILLCIRVGFSVSAGCELAVKRLAFRPLISRAAGSDATAVTSGSGAA